MFLGKRCEYIHIQNNCILDQHEEFQLEIQLASWTCGEFLCLFYIFFFIYYYLAFLCVLIFKLFIIIIIIIFFLFYLLAYNVNLF